MTVGGRALVFTVGFVSIIIFAGILSTAGYIITTIIDDALNRSRRTKWLKIPLVQMLIWGILFYAFLGVIAQTTIYWKRERVGVDMSFMDAYWFSFITSTTVGFGDYYLEHEAISEGDVVLFASLVLIAFVFLSSFLNKLAEFIQNFGGDREGGNGDDETQSAPSFEEILRDTPFWSCGSRRNNRGGIGTKRKEAKSSGAFLLLAWLFGGLKLDNVPDGCSFDGSPNPVG